VILVDVADTTTNGAALSSDGTVINCTSLGAGPDAFTYTVQDVRTNPPAIYHVNDTVRTATGTVLIFPPPLISSVSLSGNNLMMNGAGGAPNGTYSVLASTNLTVPLTNWALLTNGVFDSIGQAAISDFTSSNAMRFYLLRVP